MNKHFKDYFFRIGSGLTIAIISFSAAIIIPRESAIKTIHELINLILVSSKYIIIIGIIIAIQLALFAKYKSNKLVAFSISHFLLIILLYIALFVNHTKNDSVPLGNDIVMTGFENKKKYIHRSTEDSVAAVNYAVNFITEYKKVLDESKVTYLDSIPFNKFFPIGCNIKLSHYGGCSFEFTRKSNNISIWVTDLKIGNVIKQGNNVMRTVGGDKFGIRTINDANLIYVELHPNDSAKYLTTASAINNAKQCAEEDLIYFRP